MKEIFWLLGLPIDVLTLDEAVGRVRESARDRSSLVLATPNVNFLATCCRNPGFQKYVLESDMSLADGMPLVWLGRLLGVPVPDRVAGSTLFESLLNAPDEKPLTVYFFGGAENAARLASEAVNARRGGLRAVGYLSPGFGSVESMSESATLAAINDSNADFLSVSLGAEKGLAWIAHNRASLRIPVISHLGAVVNFLAGRANRAPPILQRLGLEWLWRIREEPSLWKRYLFDGLLLGRLFVCSMVPLLCCGLWTRRGVLGVEATDSTASAAGEVRLRLSGRLDRDGVPTLRKSLGELDAATRLEIDVSGLEYIDASAMGYLYALRYRHGLAQFEISCHGPRARRLFHWHRAGCLLGAATG